METPRPAMRGTYSIRNPLWNLLFRSMDAMLRAAVRLHAGLGGQPPKIPASPRRILVANTAHLGDVIAATSVLPVLHNAYPEAEFGFLVGSWSQPVLKGHPLVRNIHLLDHWMQNRADLSKWEKWRVYRRTRAQALREIKAARYDLAIDLGWNLPNTLPLLWQAGIPMRAGFGSAGFGPLATHCCELSESHLHISERYCKLLRHLGIDLQSLALMKPSLPVVSMEAQAHLATELTAVGIETSDYLVFHPGASVSFREWPEENWHRLAEQLTAQGYTVIFTGYSASEEASIRRMIGSLPRCVNLCGKLSWSSYVAVIQQARLLVCVDTVAGHIAGAVGTPSAVITAGRYPYLWKPMGAPSEVLMSPVPCAPCHLNAGCTGMECIRNLEAMQVLQACVEMLRVHGKEGARQNCMAKQKQ